MRLAPILVVLALGWSSEASAQEAVKPYFVLITDTSSSMTAGTGSGNNSCGQPRTRLNDAKCVLGNLVNAIGDITWALERFRQTCGTCANNVAGCPSSNETVAPNFSADRGQILVPHYEENASDIYEWLNFTCGACDAAVGADPELVWANGTPLAGALRGARRYYQGNDPDFPAAEPIRSDPYKTCRPYRAILLTDGNESCANFSQTTAATDELRATPVDADTYDIRTYVIGFGITAPDPETEAIAMRGGTDAPGTHRAFYASDETSLALAFSQIVADSVLVEICDGDDDDCDGLIDEGFTKYCDRPAGVLTPTLCADPGDPCDGVDDNCFDGTNDEVVNACGTCGPTPAEICNTIDDDCDGFINEGGVCGGCVPQAEICDGLDNDCDGTIDEGLTRTCGRNVGVCTTGVEMCAAGAWLGCTATLGSAETCNDLDDDCDGVVDGIAESCGPPETGECQPGTRICLAGTFGTCTGGIGPAEELCDGLDNDCDGTIDDGASGTGVACATGCGPGATACVDGGLVCVGGGVGVPETCNRIDDDCDGVVDEDLPSMGTCTEGGLLCVPGELRCVEGAYQCVGGSPPAPEVCDCVDNDCDDSIDEGDLCGPAATCLAGPYCGCARPCTGEEFPCTLGYSCTTPDDPTKGFCVPDECATVSCPPIAGVAQVCVAGACVDACSQVSCAPPFLCRGSDGICVPDSCSFFPDRCAAEEVCIDAACVANACAISSCGEQACRDGACVPSCAGVSCPAGRSCTQGACVEDPCGGTYCPIGQTCDRSSTPEPGACVEDFCDVVVCRAGQVCEPVSGDCVTDPCAFVACPTGQVCDGGDCFLPGDLQPPIRPEFVSAAGGGGFSCRVGAVGARGRGAMGGAGALVLVLVLGGVLGGRRRARGLRPRPR